MSNGYNGLGLTASGKRKILEGKAFESFFPKAISTDPILNKNGGVSDTVDYCGQIVAQTLDHTKQLAKALKRDTLNETCQAVFDFFYKHYQYKMDKHGVEQLRSPARAWKDRKTGIDCDCFSISVGSVLSNLNIPFYFRIVKMYGRNYYQHIYIVVPKTASADLNKRNNYIVIDPVLDKYDLEAPGITDKKDIKMEGLPIQYLNGIEENRLGREYHGTGEHFMAAHLVKHLHGRGHKLHTEHYKHKFGVNHPESIHRDFLNRTKLHLINTRDHIAKHPHHYAHIYNPNVLKGHFDHAIKHWDNDHTREAALHHLSETEHHAFKSELQGVGELLNGTADEMFAGLSGFGGLGRKKGKKNGFFTKIKNAVDHVKKAAQHATKEIGKGIKNAAKKVAAVAKKVGHAILKYNPLTLAMRGGFLLALKTNFGRIASRLYWGYFPLTEARKHGVSQEYHSRAVKAIAQVEKIFTKLGGTTTALKQAIITGRASKVASKFASQGKFNGLGVVVAAASIASAGAILGTVVELLKKIFGGKKKGTEVTENGREAAEPTDANSSDPGTNIVNAVDQIQSAVTTVAKEVDATANTAQAPATTDTTTNSSSASRDESKSTSTPGIQPGTPSTDDSDVPTSKGGDNSTKTDTATTTDNADKTGADTTSVPAEKSNTPLIIGGLAATALVAAFAFGGKNKKTKAATDGVGEVKKTSAKKTTKKKVKVKIK